MKKIITFFDAKPYDKEWFDKANTQYTIRYLDSKLTPATVQLARGSDAVCAFVNDTLDAEVIDALYDMGVRVIAMRCAGYSNVDFKRAYGKISVVRVPAYSPYAVAEHAIGLLLTVNRKLHRAYNRTRDFNFSLVGLTGVDLHGKTVGVIGTGKIGRAFIDICRGFGMRVIAYDAYPAKDSDIEYVSLDELFAQSDVISLHCPLTEQTRHLLNADAFAKMKPGVFIINTSRGALLDTEALLDALNTGKVRGAGLDVYEEEAELFFEDNSGNIIKDDVLALLVSRPNVVLTSHQAFLTEEALQNIAQTTLDNLNEFFAGASLTNEVCYRCDIGKVVEDCRKWRKERCF
ncbi:MAG TPA: 2-hydroxyacid dehydrogenase [Candidatus Limiplasma sp.]|nr:2-hydroxyacid dehydrogenase [Candidatus Limiplasma sp.]HPS80815.1 2-hydroxyacid dehydrogenase [Candidatus Limiplasma sp.]